MPHQKLFWFQPWAVNFSVEILWWKKQHPCCTSLLVLQLFLVPFLYMVGQNQLFLRRKADHFIFSVESVGQVRPEEVVEEAIL